MGSCIYLTSPSHTNPHPPIAFFPPRELVKQIESWGINMLFVVGGNGGHAGAKAIDELCQQREVNCCVVGLPKSIDNDILLIDK